MLSFSLCVKTVLVKIAECNFTNPIHWGYTVIYTVQNTLCITHYVLHRLRFKNGHLSYNFMLISFPNIHFGFYTFMACNLSKNPKTQGEFSLNIVVQL